MPCETTTPISPVKVDVSDKATKVETNIDFFTATIIIKNIYIKC